MERGFWKGAAVGVVVGGLMWVGIIFAVSAIADPKDGNPWVTIRHCEAQVDAENRENQPLGYLIRIGEGVGEGRIVEEGTLRPGEKLRRIYRGEFFVRIRLGLNSDHYYSSHEGSTHCTGNPSPSPSPSTSPTPVPSPSPSPTPPPSPSPSESPSPSTNPSPSPSPSTPASSSPSPSLPPSEGADATSSQTVSPGPGGTASTGGGGPVFWFGIAVLALLVAGSAIVSFVKRER